MASMTDYMILHDDAFELSTSPAGPGDVRKLDFSLPANFTIGTRRALPLLAFIVNPVSDDVELGFWVNPSDPNLIQTQREQLLTWPNGPHIDQGLWEGINGQKFNEGQANSIFFRVLRGRVRLRDVVLWYQRGSGD